MNATAMRATTTSVSCRVAAPAGRASVAVVAPLRRGAAAGSSSSSSGRRNTSSSSSSSSKLNGAAVANASSKTLAVERVRSDEDDEEEDLGEDVWKWRKSCSRAFSFHRSLACLLLFSVACV